MIWHPYVSCTFMVELIYYRQADSLSAYSAFNFQLMIRKATMKHFIWIFIIIVSTAFAEDIQLDGPVSDWNIKLHDGAKGSMVSVAKGVYQITKDNPEGVIEIRLKQPVLLEGPKRWFLRSEFQNKGQTSGTLFFYRLPTSETAPPNFHPSGSRTFSPDSLLINTHGDSWEERIYSVQMPGKQNFYPTILIIGNPAQFTVRNIYLTQTEKILPVTDTPDRQPSYSREQIDAILATRTHATAEVTKDEHGELRMIVNGKTVVPFAYRNEFRVQHQFMFRNEDFFDAGVPLTQITIPLCHDLTDNYVVLGNGQYDWTKIDEVFYRALSKAPYGTYHLTMSLYEPYLGWCRENDEEIWRNERGERALGNNTHLKQFNNSPDKNYMKGRLAFWPSYSSLKWREDYCRIIHDVISYIMKQPYGKVIAGFQFSGGDDGQFQYRNDDFSLPAQHAFRRFLKNKYGTLSNLNRIWKTAYESFEQISLPTMLPTEPGETPFLAPGLKSDCREFQEHEGWTLRETFSRAIKEAAGKKIVTLCWGIPDAFTPADIDQAPHLDIQITPQNYPSRRNGYSYQVHPPLTYRLYGKLWFNELDLRSWRSKINDELAARWMNPSTTPDAWRSTHRKVLGPSFAGRLGWWYHSLGYQGGRFFDAPEIMADIKKVGELYAQMQSLPYRAFRPDVCIVADASSNYFIEALPYAAYSNPNAKGNGSNLFQLIETSGVPYDRAYLKDILKYPQLQNYKVYIFMHNCFISADEREAIAKLLKNNGRTLIWVYSSGYIDENGKSTENMRKLTGFTIETEEKFARQMVYTVPTHPLNEGRHEVMSYLDMVLSLQMPFGLEKIWGSPCQIFRPTDLAQSEIVSKDGQGMPAGGYREFNEWKSLLLTTPFGLTPKLMNTIAKKTGSYIAGKAGHNIAMNGNFACIHPLFDDHFEFITPPGVTEVLDADSGKVIGHAPKVTLNLVSGSTVWLFMR